uniref:Uncharacterized protein n=1 Tax=Rhipicephalus zambeziensis TaxID=60191 RepID=A0A224Y7P6_9ACAR
MGALKAHIQSSLRVWTGAPSCMQHLFLQRTGVCKRETCTNTGHDVCHYCDKGSTSSTVTCPVKYCELRSTADNYKFTMGVQWSRCLAADPKVTGSILATAGAFR